MKIDKAIEIKTRTGEEFLNTDPDEIDEADRLSIEAMKRISAMRAGYRDREIDLLEGETED
ncbi:hypothetical protein ES706_05276 [subsurface metagenome]